MADVLVRGRVRTMDPARPLVDALLLRGGRVAALGGDAEVAAADLSVPVWALPPAAVALPGFVDPHLHVLATAAARLSVDCGAQRAPTISALVGVLAEAAGARPAGAWIRGAGYDDAFLLDRRHPDRDDLDRAAPRHPVVLHHRTGHVAVLSSAALAALGVPEEAPPGDGPVVRDAAGRPTGLVVDGHALLAGVPPLADGDLAAAVADVGAALAAAGLTAVGDATATNGPSEIRLLAGHVASGALPLRLSVMPGAASLDAVAAAGFGPGPVAGAGGGAPADVRLGPAKVVPARGEDPAGVAAVVAAAHAAGWPVAIHAVDVDEVEAALEALEASPAPLGAVDRVEHAALALPEQVRRLGARGVAIAGNPGFLVERARKYVEEVPAVERAWLHRVVSFLAAGSPYAAASDSPVGAARPLALVEAAVRRHGEGTTFAPEERLDVAAALELITVRAAAVDGRPGGWLRPGGPADLVVLGADPVATPAADVAAIPVLATLLGGAATAATVDTGPVARVAPATPRAPTAT